MGRGATLLLLWFLATGFARPPVSQSAELNAAERMAIDGGGQIVRQEKVPASSWPRVSVHQFIDATPQEAAAVFTDYARHASYIPGVKRSVVTRQLGPTVTEVDYVLEVPLYADEDYTVRDSLSTYDGGASYRVDWVKVRARSTKEIVGSARFEPYRNGRTVRDGTLITYVNLVTPGQLLAGPFKRRALGQVRETVAALVRQIDAERAGDPALLESQVATLMAALSR
jgi:hypothetical protein